MGKYYLSKRTKVLFIIMIVFGFIICSIGFIYESSKIIFLVNGGPFLIIGLLVLSLRWSIYGDTLSSKFLFFEKKIKISTISEIELINHMDQYMNISKHMKITYIKNGRKRVKKILTASARIDKFNYFLKELETLSGKKVKNDDGANFFRAYIKFR